MMRRYIRASMMVTGQGRCRSNGPPKGRGRNLGRGQTRSSEPAVSRDALLGRMFDNIEQGAGGGRAPSSTFRPGQQMHGVKAETRAHVSNSAGAHRPLSDSVTGAHGGSAAQRLRHAAGLSITNVWSDAQPKPHGAENPRQGSATRGATSSSFVNTSDADRAKDRRPVAHVGADRLRQSERSGGGSLVSDPMLRRIAGQSSAAVRSYEKDLDAKAEQSQKARERHAAGDHRGHSPQRRVAREQRRQREARRAALGQSGSAATGAYSNQSSGGREPTHGSAMSRGAAVRTAAALFHPCLRQTSSRRCPSPATCAFTRLPADRCLTELRHGRCGAHKHGTCPWVHDSDLAVASSTRRSQTPAEVDLTMAGTLAKTAAEGIGLCHVVSALLHLRSGRGTTDARSVPLEAVATLLARRYLAVNTSGAASKLYDDGNGRAAAAVTTDPSVAVGVMEGSGTEGFAAAVMGMQQEVAMMERRAELRSASPNPTSTSGPTQRAEQGLGGGDEGSGRLQEDQGAASVEAARAALEAEADSFFGDVPTDAAAPSVPDLTSEGAVSTPPVDPDDVGVCSERVLTLCAHHPACIRVADGAVLEMLPAVSDGLAFTSPSTGEATTASIVDVGSDATMYAALWHATPWCDPRRSRPRLAALKALHSLSTADDTQSPDAASLLATGGVSPEQVRWLAVANAAVTSSFSDADSGMRVRGRCVSVGPSGVPVGGSVSSCVKAWCATLEGAIVSTLRAGRLHHSTQDLLEAVAVAARAVALASDCARGAGVGSRTRTHASRAAPHGGESALEVEAGGSSPVLINGRVVFAQAPEALFVSSSDSTAFSPQSTAAAVHFYHTWCNHIMEVLALSSRDVWSVAAVEKRAVLPALINAQRAFIAAAATDTHSASNPPDIEGLFVRGPSRDAAVFAALSTHHAPGQAGQSAGHKAKEQRGSSAPSSVAVWPAIGSVLAAITQLAKESEALRRETYGSLHAAYVAESSGGRSPSGARDAAGQSHFSPVVTLPGDVVALLLLASSKARQGKDAFRLLHTMKTHAAMRAGVESGRLLLASTVAPDSPLAKAHARSQSHSGQKPMAGFEGVSGDGTGRPNAGHSKDREKRKLIEDERHFYPTVGIGASDAAVAVAMHIACEVAPSTAARSDDKGAANTEGGDSDSSPNAAKALPLVEALWVALLTGQVPASDVVVDEYTALPPTVHPAWKGVDMTPHRLRGPSPGGASGTAIPCAGVESSAPVVSAVAAVRASSTSGRSVARHCVPTVLAVASMLRARAATKQEVDRVLGVCGALPSTFAKSSLGGCGSSVGAALERQSTAAFLPHLRSGAEDTTGDYIASPTSTALQQRPGADCVLSQPTVLPFVTGSDALSVLRLEAYARSIGLFPALKECLGVHTTRPFLAAVGPAASPADGGQHNIEGRPPTSGENAVSMAQVRGPVLLAALDLVVKSQLRDQLEVSTAPSRRTAQQAWAHLTLHSRIATACVTAIVHTMATRVQPDVDALRSQVDAAPADSTVAGSAVAPLVGICPSPSVEAAVRQRRSCTASKAFDELCCALALLHSGQVGVPKDIAVSRARTVATDAVVAAASPSSKAAVRDTSVALSEREWVAFSHSVWASSQQRPDQQVRFGVEPGEGLSGVGTATLRLTLGIP